MRCTKTQNETGCGLTGGPRNFAKVDHSVERRKLIIAIEWISLCIEFDCSFRIQFFETNP